MITLLISVLIIFINTPSHSQRLVEYGNQWNFIQYPTFTPNTYSYSTRIGKDTLVNDKKFSKLDYSNEEENSNWIFLNSYLRQDSTNKVFLKDGGENEILLYDFSLEVNDTFQIDNCVFVVLETDSITLNNGKERKRIKLGLKNYPEIYQYWIDGIGSDFSLIRHYGLCYTDFSEGLLCFYTNEELLYPDSPMSCFVTGTSESHFHNKLKIFPSPAETFINIEVDNFYPASYFIYNLSGNIVKSGKISSSKIQVDLTDINAGYYILTIENTERKRFSQKLIKIL